MQDFLFPSIENPSFFLHVLDDSKLGTSRRSSGTLPTSGVVTVLDSYVKPSDLFLKSEPYWTFGKSFND
jgi:hypothetical protein